MNQVEDKKVTRCPSGHWYSAATYDSCPFCNGGGARQAAPVDQPAQPFPPIANQGGNTVPLNPPPANGMPFSGGQEPPPTATVPLVQNTPSFVNTAQQHLPSTTPIGSGSTQPQDAGKTVGVFASKVSGSEPVVGWLVAVEGKHKGQDFRLKVGKNFIGRDRTMDVCLANDNTVSRNKHSVIVFEPKQKIFIIQSGDARELSYLNDEIVLETKQLSIYDKITIGETTLMFIPLCGDQFSW